MQGYVRSPAMQSDGVRLRRHKSEKYRVNCINLNGISTKKSDIQERT